MGEVLSFRRDVSTCHTTRVKKLFINIIDSLKASEKIFPVGVSTDVLSSAKSKMSGIEQPTKTTDLKFKQVQYNLMASASNSSCSSGRISPESPTMNDDAFETSNRPSSPETGKNAPLSPAAAALRRRRTVSGSKAEELVMRTKGKVSLL